MFIAVYSFNGSLRIVPSIPRTNDISVLSVIQLVVQLPQENVIFKGKNNYKFI